MQVLKYSLRIAIGYRIFEVSILTLLEDGGTRHTYENPGNYTATVTVTDATGQTASDSTQVTVQPAPTTDEPPTTNETVAETAPLITEGEAEELPTNDTL